MTEYIKQHKVKSTIFGLIIVAIIGMAITGTLSYPYIMVDRQIELLRYCSHDTTVFDTKDYGFHIEAPTGFCILPHRIFPADGSIQVVPTGKYSVINEYAKGTINNVSQATILFEQSEVGRSPEELLKNMESGGFLNEATISEFTNKQNLHVYVVKNTTGLDAGPHYNWAFVLHPNGKVLLSVLNSRPETPEVFDYILDHLGATK